MSVERSIFSPLEEEDGRLTEDDDTPHEVHVVPESSQTRWSPIDDLDSFFIRMYQYHQGHGYLCIMVKKTLELIQFVFMVFLTVFLLHFVDYDILFRNKVSSNETLAITKIYLSDAIKPIDKAIGSITIFAWICITFAVLFWLLRTAGVIYEAAKCWETKIFFNTVLNIPDDEVDNVTWHDVQQKFRAVQKDHQMCIHKQELTELDICHRILRFKNYMVAMVNKGLIPAYYTGPFGKSKVFFTNGLKYNLEVLLFRGPFSPFETSWQLKDDYKRVNKRKELAKALEKNIMWTAIINLLLAPIILLWQAMYAFFHYAEVIKRDPSFLGLRCWSLYSKLYLRHFNELDHEVNARLTRAYRPATKYVASFASFLVIIIAKNVLVFSGSLLVVLCVLTIYDEDVIGTQNVLLDISIFSIIATMAKSCIPDENQVWCPEQFMAAVLSQVHYLPESWYGKAHTNSVHDSFSCLFVYKGEYLIDEVLSPVITPFILFFKLRPRALEIVDFFRQFTVEVVGVGDVCSFAQMDLRKHGSSSWQPNVQGGVKPENNQYTMAEDGKVELSLVHFKLTNPEWKPPPEAEEFIERIRGGVNRDLANATINNLGMSLNSNSGLGAQFDAMTSSYLQLRAFDEPTNPFLHSSQPSRPDVLTFRGAINRSEGPYSSFTMPESGRLRGISADPNVSLGASMFGIGPDIHQIDMAASALYLHSIHHRQVQNRRRGYVSGESSVFQRPHQTMSGIAEQPDERRTETLPLLFKH